MGIFTGTGLDPANDITTDVWPATIAEIKARGLEIHGSLSKRNVDDGATAVVLKATETKSGRVVAIKVYKHPDRHVEHRNGQSIPMTNFFENERRMLVGLEGCPHVPRYYYSVATEDATVGKKIQPFHVMEFVEGERITKFAKESLSKGGRREALVGLFRDLLRAVDSIHQFGYLHRDLSDGNVLVDRNSRIRLIDLAEASPLGEEHTRLVSTPGLGTEGVATPDQQRIRKIQTDDVRDTCTIGYALFTGRWKQTGENEGHWRDNLQKSGVPPWITRILIKGMKPRDPNRRRDRSVWNTAREVDEAINRVCLRQLSRKRFARGCAWFMVAAVVFAVIGYFALERIQHQSYVAELNRLKDQRIFLGEKPQTARADVRVVQRIEAAKKFESNAEQASRDGRVNEAVQLLSSAVSAISEAARLADDIHRLRPLVEPLRKILHENDQWNRKNAAIVQRLTRLGKDFQEIQRHVDSGDPDRAWTMIAAIQPELVKLIDDNQQSFKIAALLDQIEAESVGLDPALKKQTAFEQIAASRQRASQYYDQGQWREARAEILGALTSLKSFLNQHETPDQRKNRLASNAALVNTQLAANESLQKQVSELTQQLSSAKTSHHEILFQGAQYKKERDDSQKQLAQVRSELADANSKFSKQVQSLATATAERDRLAGSIKNKDSQIADNDERLSKGSAAWSQQSKELADAKTELASTKELLDRLSNSPSSGAESVKRQLELAKAEKAIREFNPESLKAANDRLIEESKVYQQLLQTRKQETDLGKTDRHADVKLIDSQLQSQFRIVVESLRKRDQQDAEAWTSIQTKIDHQVNLRHRKIEEGWAETSEEVRKIQPQIDSLTKQQDQHQAGKSRSAANAYDFKDWDDLSALTDVKLAESSGLFGELKLGTKFTNSFAQSLTYLPPGQFQRGSPKEPIAEEGRDDDETLHTVILKQGFFLADTETTQVVYARITGEKPWSGQALVREGDDYPAVYVSGEDAEKFIKRLNEIEHANGTLPMDWEYRLPTEAQWEYAARAGSQHRFCFGDDESQLGEYAWYNKNAWNIREKYAHQVGKKRPNQWGLFDLHGNCWEWTADDFAAYPSGTVTDPFVRNGGSDRVYRGGGFNGSSSFCRSANRNRSLLGDRDNELGFRLACIQLTSQ